MASEGRLDRPWLHDRGRCFNPNRRRHLHSGCNQRELSEQPQLTERAFFLGRLLDRLFLVTTAMRGRNSGHNGDVYRQDSDTPTKYA
jgi:hypothetical protein